MKRTAQELANQIGARVEGHGSVELLGIAAPERAAASDLIYVDSLKNTPRAAASSAACVIALDGLDLPGKTVLRHRQPKVAFAKAAVLLLDKPVIAPPGIHPTAVIATDAQIASSAGIGPYAVVGANVRVGERTQIGPHTSVAAGCQIGADCRIHPRVTFYTDVRIGDRVEIHSGAVIGADGFGYAYGEGRHWKFPQAGIVEIGDDVEIGANTTIDRGSLDDTQIGEGVKLDNLVHIGHNCKIGAHTVIAALVGLSGSCTFGKNVIVGGQAGFGERCELEDGAVIGGQSGVLGGKVVRTGQTVWGTPARPLERFKEEYAWYSRLPDLAARIKELESKVRG
jgi:UDP-3-O-[3-hydroxymyristoyl] glucosamine N-acyltransferase